MAMSKAEQEDTRLLWQWYIQDQAESELDQKHWCEENNIPYRTFCYWKRKLANEDNQSEEMEWLRVEAEESYGGGTELAAESDGIRSDKTALETSCKKVVSPESTLPHFGDSCDHTRGPRILSKNAMRILIGEFIIEVPSGANTGDLEAVLRVVKNVC